MKRSLVPTISIVLLIIVNVFLGKFLYDNILSDDNRPIKKAMNTNQDKSNIPSIVTPVPTAKSVPIVTPDSTATPVPTAIPQAQDKAVQTSASDNQSDEIVGDEDYGDDDSAGMSEDGYLIFHRGEEGIVDSVRIGNGNANRNMLVSSSVAIERRVLMKGVVGGGGKLIEFDKPLNDFMLEQNSPNLDVRVDPADVVKLMPKDSMDFKIKIRTSQNAKLGDYRITIKLIDLGKSASVVKNYLDLKEVEYLVRIVSQ